MMLLNKFLFALFIILCPLISSARLAHYSEAPVEFEFYNVDMKVLADGRAESIYEQLVHVLNERGRENFGTQRLYYNGDIEKIDIIEAKSILNGEEYKVPKEMIEIKPLASNADGFDQQYQVVIPYSQVIVGAKLYLKYKFTKAKYPIPNYFDLKANYGIGAIWKKSTLNLTSEIPFKVKINDPHKLLEIKEEKQKNQQTINVVLRDKAYTELINEHNNLIEEKDVTYVTISSADSFLDISKSLAPKYENVANQELPELYNQIKVAAEQAQSDVEKINIITSRLSDKIRYMGDWRTIDGAYYPRDLKQIVESGFGDCKDYATSVVSILRRIGFKANVASVLRGVNYLPLSNPLPSLDNFNHVIVKAIAKDGRVFWIDPTNFTSMTEGVYPDISGRPALVLDSKEPSYERVPEIDFRHAKFNISEVIKIMPQDIVESAGELSFLGEEAIFFAGATLRYSPKEIEEIIIYHTSGEMTPLKSNITLPDLSSRIVKDVHIKYDYQVENNIAKTNLGSGLTLDARNWLNSFLRVSNDMEGTLFLGYPMTATRKILVEGKKALNLKALDFQIDTPWARVKRTCKQGKLGIEINEHIEILKKHITSEEVKSPEYLKFKNQLKKNFSQSILVLSKT